MAIRTYIKRRMQFDELLDAPASLGASTSCISTLRVPLHPNRRGRASSMVNASAEVLITSGRWLRTPQLYPAELRARCAYDFGSMKTKGDCSDKRLGSVSLPRPIGLDRVTLPGDRLRSRSSPAPLRTVSDVPSMRARRRRDMRQAESSRYLQISRVAAWQ